MTSASLFSFMNFIFSGDSEGCVQREGKISSCFSSVTQYLLITWNCFLQVENNTDSRIFSHWASTITASVKSRFTKNISSFSVFCVAENSGLWITWQGKHCYKEKEFRSTPLLCVFYHVALDNAAAFYQQY